MERNGKRNGKRNGEEWRGMGRNGRGMERGKMDGEKDDIMRFWFGGG